MKPLVLHELQVKRLPNNLQVSNHSFSYGCIQKSQSIQNLVNFTDNSDVNLASTALGLVAVSLDTSNVTVISPYDTDAVAFDTKTGKAIWTEYELIKRAYANGTEKEILKRATSKACHFLHHDCNDPKITSILGLFQIS